MTIEVVLAMAWWWKQSKRNTAFKAALTSREGRKAARHGVDAAQSLCSTKKVQFEARELALKASKRARQPCSSGSQHAAHEIVDINQLQKRDPTIGYRHSLCMQGYSKLRKWTTDLEERAVF